VEVLKVSSRSNPNSVAGAMAGVVRQSGAVEVQVIGAGALNQAVKAIAIARGYVAPSGIELICIPTFQDIEIDGEGRTAIRLAVEDRERRVPSPTPASVAGPAPAIDVRSSDDDEAAAPKAAPTPAPASDHVFTR
jgi:stage V sporulation protein S